MTEHFYNGFIKRAQDYGLSVVEADRLAKTAAPNLIASKTNSSQAGSLKKNWNNTGYDLTVNQRLPNPAISSNSITHHQGSITPMAYLQKHYGAQTETELDKARKYTESKGFYSPGEPRSPEMQGHQVDIALNLSSRRPHSEIHHSPHNLNTPVQVYTDPAASSQQSFATPPSNYQSLPEYTNQVIESYTGNSNGLRAPKIPYVNLNSEPSFTPYVKNPDPLVDQTESINRTSLLNASHELPNLTPQHTKLLADYLRHRRLPREERFRNSKDFLKNTLDPLSKLHPYPPALTNNSADDLAETFRHEIIHNYTRNQTHPKHPKIIVPEWDSRLKATPYTPDYANSSHFTNPAERATGLSTFQQDLYGQTGRRAESPEEFKKIIGGLLTAPDLEKAMNEQGFKGNTKRYLRFLKDSQLKAIDSGDSTSHDELMRQESELAPGFVQNAQPSPVSKIAAILKRRLS